MLDWHQNGWPYNVAFWFLVQVGLVVASIAKAARYFQSWSPIFSYSQLCQSNFSNQTNFPCCIGCLPQAEFSSESFSQNSLVSSKNKATEKYIVLHMLKIIGNIFSDKM